MSKLPKKLQQKLTNRENNNALRQLGAQNSLVDFSSNDYLGFAKNKVIFNSTHQYLINNNIIKNGATGSRLLSGNHSLYNETEQQLSKFYNSETALIFNSGYNANLGLFSSIPQRGDIIFYDEYIHASIRDGIKMSNAKAYKFEHNNLEDLKQQIHRQAKHDSDIYIVTESVFSMDGDSPNLNAFANFSQNNNYNLIIDEAHAIGVFGDNGCGLTQDLNHHIFARIITFGKAIGSHGAAILGSESLKDYLVNFSRPFIYTTGLSPHALATIKIAYEEIKKTLEIKKLQHNISFFKSKIEQFQLKHQFIDSNSAIHCCVIPGNDNVKHIAKILEKNNFNVKPILSPTVKKGQERLRFCLHSYNSEVEITKVLQLLSTFVIV